MRSNHQAAFGLRLGIGLATIITTFACWSPPSWSDATPKPAIALNNEGVTALLSGDFKLAEEKFQAALGIDPTYDMARKNLAKTYNNQGLAAAKSDPALAATLFQKSLDYDPNNQTTQNNLNAMQRNPAVPVANLEQYTVRAQKMIRAHWHAPESALNIGKKAVAIFTINQDGTIKNVELKDSTGMPEADEGVLTAVRTAAPFGALPAGSPASVKMKMDFDFSRNAKPVP